MKTLICNIELFDAEQHLAIIEDSKIIYEKLIPNDMLVSSILSTYENDDSIAKIKLFGVPEYNKMVARELKKSYSNTYGQNKTIDIEVA